MNAELHRLGLMRGTLVVLATSALAVLALSFSGLSVAARDHAVATVTPQIPRSAVTVPAAPAVPDRRAASRGRRDTVAASRRKRCPAIDGVEFTVSVAQRCPKPLNEGPRTHLSARLRRAASRPRPRPAVVATSKTQKQVPGAGSKTTPRRETPKTTAAGGVEGPPPTTGTPKRISKVSPAKPRAATTLSSPASESAAGD